MRTAAARTSDVTDESATTLAFSVAKLTLAFLTPGIAFSVFSTRMTHEAQVIPMTSRSISAGEASIAERAVIGNLLVGWYEVDAQGSHHWKVKAALSEPAMAVRVFHRTV